MSSAAKPAPGAEPAWGWRTRWVVWVVVFAAAFALPLSAPLSSRFALAYALGTACVCALTYRTILRPRREEMQRFVREVDARSAGPAVAAGVVILGSLATLAVLERTVSALPPVVRNLHLLISVFAVLVGWLTLHTIFALRYAALYYGPAQPAGAGGPGEAGPARGLSFPEPDLVPDYWDFLYYSFTIGMCYQTSDVSVVHSSIRRFTLLHSVFSYLYGVGLLSLIVSSVGGAL
jgi:uncharacterized membrane protein